MKYNKYIIFYLIAITMTKYIYILQSLFVSQCVDSELMQKSYSSMRNDGVVSNWYHVNILFDKIKEELSSDDAKKVDKQFDLFRNKKLHKTIEELMKNSDIIEILEINYKLTDDECDSETWYLAKIPILE